MLELEVNDEQKTYNNNQLMGYVKDACRKNDLDRFNVVAVNNGSSKDDYPEFRLEAAYTAGEYDDKMADQVLLIETLNIGYVDQKDEYQSEEPETLAMVISNGQFDSTVLVSLNDVPDAIRFVSQTGRNLLTEMAPDRFPGN